jgi:hypothetical protein
MMSKITLKLDASLVRDLRATAAEQNTSIGAMLSARLEQVLHERKTYKDARVRALKRLQQGLDLRWYRPPATRFTNVERPELRSNSGSTFAFCISESRLQIAE